MYFCINIKIIKMRRKLFLFIVAMVLPLSAVWAQENNDHNFKVAKNLDILNAIYKNLDLIYVDTLDAEQVIGNGINSMLRSLDPYTVYYPEENLTDLKGMITGHTYAGIGAVVRYNHKFKNVIVVEPYEGNPAAEVGLKKGDVILSIDDTTMVDKDVSYVSSHLRGEPGTTFVLKIKRPSTGRLMEFKITRRSIYFPPMPYYGMQKDSIGYISLTSFTEDCDKEVRRAFIDLKNQGMKGLVLDLRGNRGGTLSSAVSIVNMFVPKDLLLVKTIGKLSRANRNYTTTVEPIDSVMPIVVLVNDETASSSEITAGSLQDLDRAVVIGTRTYGKGLVQTTVDLPYNGQLKLTSSKYYIPSGRCVQAINYKHSNGRYTEEHIADSLTKVFYTANGREVRDGGGIKPDIEVVPDSLPNIAYYLENRDTLDVMLNYVLDYVNAHPTIAPASEFELSDEDYEEFKQRVIESGFTYDPESEKALKSLKKIIEFEGYYEDAKEEFEKLENKLKHDLAKDLEYNKKTLKRIITGDILSAYYYQAGVIENSLNHDKFMKEACRILNDKEEYRKLLSPNK